MHTQPSGEQFTRAVRGNVQRLSPMDGSSAKGFVRSAPRLQHQVVLRIRESRRKPFPVSVGLMQFGANPDNLALATDQRRHRWSSDAANDLQQDRLL